MWDIRIILLTFLCVALYTGQSFCNRLFSGNNKGSPDIATPVFSSVYGVLVAVVTLLLNGGRFSPSLPTVFFGMGNGVILFLYNLGMIQAARRGPYTFQSIMMLFGNVVVCLLFAALFWGDHITGLQLLGIAVMLAAFVVLNAGGLRFTGVKKGYFFWVISLFLTNGFYGVVMDAQQRTISDERNEMILLIFLSLAVISLGYMLILHRNGLREAYAMGKRAALSAVASSLCAAFAVYLLMLLLQSVPSYILYTVVNGGVLVFSAVLSFVILKEKPTKMTLVGVALSAASIVLLSL
ncbi:MAG: EamA family transporter [Clostridia bacterium]|nr:EamA family transporter [Clostridia bacterium]